MNKVEAFYLCTFQQTVEVMKQQVEKHFKSMEKKFEQKLKAKAKKEKKWSAQHITLKGGSLSSPSQNWQVIWILKFINPQSSNLCH